MDSAFRSDTPLYRQIADWLKRSIVSGAFRPGDRLPSIRDLALRLEVTPNTLQRALQILEDEGLLHTERTSGKFVTTDAVRLRTLRDELLRDRIRALISDLRQHGYGREEILTCFEREWY